PNLHLRFGALIQRSVAVGILFVSQEPRTLVSVTHLNQVELAARWKISPRTLERWRWTGEGPAFIKIGGRVVYRLEDVEAYEANRHCSSTADKPAVELA
ncbi:helix-turn-helix transcriptional regulator, partial [Oceanicella actignis]|uniref:helix-turn-helix transcriptional regulator n=1 Tax=Oceanicella actignis TaxID=1189325 RepID=UPI002013896E